MAKIENVYPYDADGQLVLAKEFVLWCPDHGIRSNIPWKSGDPVHMCCSRARSEYRYVSRP